MIGPLDHLVTEIDRLLDDGDDPLAFALIVEIKSHVTIRDHLAHQVIDIVFNSSETCHNLLFFNDCTKVIKTIESQPKPLPKNRSGRRHSYPPVRNRPQPYRRPRRGHTRRAKPPTAVRIPAPVVPRYSRSARRRCLLWPFPDSPSH